MDGVSLTGGALKPRLSKALLDISSLMAGVKSGALVQVWMPELCADGTVVLSCQGLPFAVAGVGDLLALFRCVSVRYRFSTDVMKPWLMGAVGRVYSTLEPEMSHNVQKYDKNVYLRVSEAQRCRVHSTLMVPVFGSGSRDKALAVFELVQGDRDVTFPAVLSQVTQCLQGVGLYTVDLENAALAAGLRTWPQHVGRGSHDGSGMLPLPAAGMEAGSGPRASGMQWQGTGQSMGRQAIQPPQQQEHHQHHQQQQQHMMSLSGTRRMSPASSSSGGQFAMDMEGPATAGHHTCGQASAERAFKRTSTISSSHALPPGSGNWPPQVHGRMQLSAGMPPGVSQVTGAGVGSLGTATAGGSAMPGGAGTSLQPLALGSASSALAGAEGLGALAAALAVGGESSGVKRMAGTAAARPHTILTEEADPHSRGSEGASHASGSPGSGQDRQAVRYKRTATVAPMDSTQQQVEVKVQSPQAAPASSCQPHAIAPAGIAAGASTGSSDIAAALASGSINNVAQVQQLLAMLLQQPCGGGGGSALESLRSLLQAQQQQAQQQPPPQQAQQQQLQQQAHSAQSVDVDALAAATAAATASTAAAAQRAPPGTQPHLPAHLVLSGTSPMQRLDPSNTSQARAQPPPPCDLERAMVKPEDGALPSSMIGQLQQHLSFPGAAGEDADGEDGDDLSDGDGDGDDDGSGGDDDGDGRGGNRGGGGSGNNRVGGGAGKRLTYEELQAKFGMGLKEAAAALGICATTLKRACRRHGIRRWPRRQIAKINRALNQQLQGPPVGVPAAAAMPTALQQAALAAVLQQQQQLAAAKAAVAAAAAAASSAQAAQQAAASSPTSATLSSPTQNVDSAAALHRLTMPGMQPMQMQMASTTGMQTGAMQGVPQFSGAGQLPMQMGVMLPQQLAGMPGLGMQQASVLQGSMGQPAMMQPQSGMQQATMPMQATPGLGAWAGAQMEQQQAMLQWRLAQHNMQAAQQGLQQAQQQLQAQQQAHAQAQQVTLGLPGMMFQGMQQPQPMALGHQGSQLHSVLVNTYQGGASMQSVQGPMQLHPQQPHVLQQQQHVHQLMTQQGLPLQQQQQQQQVWGQPPQQQQQQHLHGSNTSLYSLQGSGGMTLQGSGQGQGQQETEGATQQGRQHQASISLHQLQAGSSALVGPAGAGGLHHYSSEPHMHMSGTDLDAALANAGDMLLQEMTHGMAGEHDDSLLDLLGGSGGSLNLPGECLSDLGGQEATSHGAM